MANRSSTIDQERVARLVGSPEQLVNVERLMREDGSARGTSILAIRNPQGFSFDVLIDRALDIGWAEARGLPLAWRAIQGPAASTRYEPEGNGWTRTFSGGLLTTCGLRATGAPSTVDGTHFGLHGRIGHIPAQNVHWQFIDHHGEPCIEITGQVIEGGLGETPLILTRRIVANTVQAWLSVQDTVTNAGFETTGHMFRHHFNLGYPLVGPASSVTTNATLIGTRDPHPEPLPQFPWKVEVAQNPTAEFVGYCKPNGIETRTTVTDANGNRLEIEQKNEEWPWLILWRDASPGVNVLGVEPSTSKDAGRAQAELDKEVINLAPGQSREYRTDLSLSTF